MRQSFGGFTVARCSVVILIPLALSSFSIFQQFHSYYSINEAFSATAPNELLLNPSRQERSPWPGPTNTERTYEISQFIEKHPRIHVNIFSDSGFGAQMNMFFMKAICFENDVFNRTIIADGRWDRYRRPATNEDVLTGYFTPQFPVIRSVNDFNIIEEYLTDGDWDYHTKHWFSGTMNYTHDVHRVTEQKDDHIILGDVWDFRPICMFQIFGTTYSDSLYEKMVLKMCPSLQFNHRTKLEIEQIFEDNGYPNFGATKSVGFHIRRTDKVSTGEMKEYSGDDYVLRLIKAMESRNDTQEPIENCYVATDDHLSVAEIVSALARHRIPCRIYTMRPPKSDVREEDPIVFFSELSILIQSTYFIGSFESNIGTLVAVLRACDRDNPQQQRPVNASASHYANSYGISEEQWHLR